MYARWRHAARRVIACGVLLFIFLFLAYAEHFPATARLPEGQCISSSSCFGGKGRSSLYRFLPSPPPYFFPSLCFPFLLHPPRSLNRIRGDVVYQFISLF